MEEDESPARRIIAAELKLLAYRAFPKLKLADRELERAELARQMRRESFDDPTPEEIAERAAAIRAAWTPAQRAERCVGDRKEPAQVMVRVLTFDARVQSFRDVQQ